MGLSYEVRFWEALYSWAFNKYAWGHEPHEDWRNYRSDFTLSPSFNFPEREWHPGTRTEWVTPGQVWREFHAQGVDGGLPWVMVSGDNTYAKGSATRLDWFAPVTRPGQSESFGVYDSRWQNDMTWNVQAWASSSDEMRLGGYLPWGETPTHLQVFQGDALIHDDPNRTDMQWIEVPEDNLPYRAVLDAERPADVFRLSTRTHTEWTFMSDTVDSDCFEPFPVLNLDYELESDLHGDVKADATRQIALKPVSMGRGTVPGTVTTVKLDVSYDDGADGRAGAHRGSRAGRRDRPGSSSGEDIDGTSDHEPENEQGDEGLNAHGDLGPRGQRHDVGGAEGGGVGEREVEVVDEEGSPVGACQFGVELLGEGERGCGGHVVGAGGGPAAVEFEVQQGEGEDRTGPHRAAGLQQTDGGVGLLPGMEDVVDQLNGRPDGAEGQNSHQGDRHASQGGRASVDPARVAGDERQ
ncbi:hypothetical protein [Streptomyces sp. NPDC002825]|uniref:hypothetical protein n=1 Tax=Streptomyces sp. NPDC002825 TaxID=3154666 RepID=UPI00333428C8